MFNWLFTNSPAKGHLDCFQFMAVLNIVAINIYNIHKGYLNEYNIHDIWYILRNEIARSYSKCTLILQDSESNCFPQWPYSVVSHREMDYYYMIEINYLIKCLKCWVNKFSFPKCNFMLFMHAVTYIFFLLSLYFWYQEVYLSFFRSNKNSGCSKVIDIICFNCGEKQS